MPAVISWERLLSFVTSMSFPGCRRHCNAVIDGDRIEPLGDATAFSWTVRHFWSVLQNLYLLDRDESARHHAIQHRKECVDFFL